MKQLLIFAGFAALYVLLDAASFIRPLHGLNITPWNPAPGLGLVFLLRQGKQARLPLIVTVLISDIIVRGLPNEHPNTLLPALVLGVGYVLLGETLRPLISLKSLMDQRSTLAIWLSFIAIGSLINSAAYNFGYLALGALPIEHWPLGLVRFWVGDTVGIAIAMPLIWWLSSAKGRRLLLNCLKSPETLAYGACTLTVLWLVFDFVGEQAFKYFYFLFFPVIWASTRHGMVGAIVSSSLLQNSLILAVQWTNYTAVSLAELQMLSLAIAVVGYFIGTAVDEQRRASEDLRLSLRLAAAGEMAGALAHELNQPLTAASNYAASCEVLFNKRELGERMQMAIQGMKRESKRAGEVLQHLRDFFRTGATALQQLPIHEVIEPALQSFQKNAESRGIQIIQGEIEHLPVLVDPVQIQVVIRNLLANASDAAEESPTHARWVKLSTQTIDNGRLRLTVEDSGSGISQARLAEIFEPFSSSKSSGLGLGLVISRAITETHGGSLECEVANHGVFHLTLPLFSNSRDDLQSINSK